MVVDPTGTLAFAGESSNGDVYRIDLVAESVAPFVNLPFNFDGTFDPSTGDLIVSAALLNWFNGNDILRVDPVSGSYGVVAHVTGPSGPIAFDPFGNLYCGVLDPSFLPGTSRVVAFFPSQLTTEVVTGEEEGFSFSTGWDSIASLVYDPVTLRLYLAENQFFGVPELYRVLPSKATSERVAFGAPDTYFGQLEVEPGGGPARLAAYQPAEGGLIRYHQSHFAGQTLRRFALRPRRPEVTFAGAGLTGAGPVDVRFEGARPGATLMVFAARRPDPSGAEVVLPLPSAMPLFWGLSRGEQRLVATGVPVDPDGSALHTFDSTWELAGELAFQALMVDEFASFAGSTAVGVFPPVQGGYQASLGAR